MRTTGLRVIFVAALLVLAGCAAPTATPGADDSSTADTPAPDREGFADPDSDVLGWENGYWFDEPIDVDQSDGLNDSELEAYVARGMARVEHIRELEFDSTVPVSVISRTQYQRDNAGRSGSADSEFNRWNDQVWEALFVTGESEGSASAISNTTGSSVLGFYSPSDDEIKIVTDSTGAPTIDNATLIHELHHALQDQHFDLTDERYRSQTQDGDLAIDGVVEGDAKLVELMYTDRCEAGTWDCVKTPKAGGSGGGSGGSGPNLGVLLTIFQPYSDGPVYVNELYDSGGWAAVNDAMRNPPASSEQVIHRTDEEPRPIEFEDTGTNGWATFPDQGVDGSDTLGEASIYAMFWYQARTSGADTVNVRSLLDTRSAYDTYNYDARPSAGWANDRLFPYRNEADSETEYGYVWVTEWDTEKDAREFERAYLNILKSQGVAQQNDGVYVIQEGQFADAFRVVRSGDRVVIVNGPTPADVDEIRPGLAA
ncbi:Hvo_1808 family surface protein [Haloferax larsenii]|uniref:Hvo_1808 family surface protein n=1 Tax=Haloferax larsenii TaxID=302484 RepID=A0ABY5RF40_HALLR|nr:Hvo_1808 family surface protein [Haloferax larsenii]UVE50977.1 Hvo_1808 family surface protein [Haloferax larsenii]